jgi:hypothetical protein
MNADTGYPTGFPPTPGAFLPPSCAEGREIVDPWSPYRTLGEGSDPGPSAPNAFNNFIDPSLLHSWPDYDAPASPFIGLPDTGLPNSEEVQSKGLIGSPVFSDSSIPPKEAVKAKKKRTKIAGEALAILERRFDLGVYPDADELPTLAHLTGLELKSVKYWFENKRRLRKKTKGEFKFCPQLPSIMSLIQDRRVK